MSSTKLGMMFHFRLDGPMGNFDVAHCPASKTALGAVFTCPCWSVCRLIHWKSICTNFYKSSFGKQVFPSTGDAQANKTICSWIPRNYIITYIKTTTDHKAA